MKQLLSSLLVITSLASFAHAQQAKVIKVKGQQAIVQFPPGTPPVVGEMIPVGGEAQTESGAHTGRGSRAHYLAAGGTIYFTNNSATSNSTTGFTLDGRYGWNQEIFEFGPLVTIAYESTTGSSSRKLAAGGFFDFNLVANKPGVPTVYGVGAYADFGQSSTTTGSTDQTSSLVDVFVGGNVKWFGLADNVALRGDAGFSLGRSSINGQATTNSGLLIKGALAFYF